MSGNALVHEVASLFEICNHSVQLSVKINHREIDIVAEELSGLARKRILIECADYSNPVGIDKLDSDLHKLRAAAQALGQSAIFFHISRNGYTSEAKGRALTDGFDCLTLEQLKLRLFDFSRYFAHSREDLLRQTIEREYQKTTISINSGSATKTYTAITYLLDWIKTPTENRWLTLLGDYGVGKSWTLKRTFFALIDTFEKDPANARLPIFIPLQNFIKSFDFENLVTQIFNNAGMNTFNIAAFRHLVREGRIIFLLDSFDEMAQNLTRQILRENLHELFTGVGHNSKAILASRPNYFENSAERLLFVEHTSSTGQHPLDKKEYSIQTTVSEILRDNISRSGIVRLNDLSIEQRKKLFEIVLGSESPALTNLQKLFDRFQNLENISQRAVIARLLTTVAETISGPDGINLEGVSDIIPTKSDVLNEAGIFELITTSLLKRDLSIGGLSAADRLYFLERLAIFLQSRGNPPFIGPEILRELVASIFSRDLERSDSPELLLENYYRTCRRHSGLTTEGQFLDTSGQIDFPIDDDDNESRVGFSHNSLREFLIARSIFQYLQTPERFSDVHAINFSDAILGFISDFYEYDARLPYKFGNAFVKCTDSRMREILFKICARFASRLSIPMAELLSGSGIVEGIEVSQISLSGLKMSKINFRGCVFEDTDFSDSELQFAIFDNCDIAGILLDGATLNRTCFKTSNVESIFVYDEFDTKTHSYLRGRDARQWLFSRGASVYPDDDLNPLLGNPHYHAAREVAITLDKRNSGKHKEISLSRGTHLRHREFAVAFVNFMKRKKILIDHGRAKLGGGRLLVLGERYRTEIREFAKTGAIGPSFAEFFGEAGEKFKAEPDYAPCSAARRRVQTMNKQQFARD